MEMPAPSSNGETASCESGPRSDVPIDLPHLRRFTLGDHELETEVLGLFIEQAPLTIKAMLDARTDRDWQRAAHTLKGSARAVGAWKMAELAERAERIGGLADRAACERLLDQLGVAAEDARRHIIALSRAG